MPTLKPLTQKQALEILRERGHSYRSAAAVIGVNHSHLYRVLMSDDRPSARTLAAISKLPIRKKEVAK